MNTERRHRGGWALAVICGAVAVLVSAGCASPVKSPSPVPTTAASQDCSAQPPGCGSASGTAQSLAGFTWSAAPAPPLSPRFAQASVWTGTELLIWGGIQWSRMTMAGNGAAYDPVTRTWTPMPPSPLSPRNTAFAAWTGTEALFWGGGNGNGSQFTNGASYDPASRTWTMLPAAPLPAGANDQAVVWTGTQMVVIEPGASAAFDPATRSWTALPPVPGVTGCQPVAVGASWTGSEVIAWAASNWSAHPTCSIAYSPVPGRTVWGVVSSWPDSNCYFPFGTTAPVAGRLLFLGGVECPLGPLGPANSFFDGAWFDPSSGTWTDLPAKFSGGSGPAVWTGSAMVVFNTKAGATPDPRTRPSGMPPDAAAAFDPSTGAWTDLARCPAHDLTDASLAWTGRQLIAVTMDDEGGDTLQVDVLSRPVRHSN